MSWFGRSKTPPPLTTAPGANKAASGKALLLIGFNDATKQWEVGAEALGVLERMRGPLCTVSVCGRARQGKSFLLNQLLSSFTGVSVQKPNGFVVSPTHQSCTRGIWIWSSPIPAKTATGQPCHVLLMDCEGVDAVDQGQKHSAQVFCLAVLLSSVFVYNQLGSIDSVAIERLAMVCELAKRIKAGARGQADFHPAFIWLLRDFQLLLQEGNKQLTPLEYLEHTLNNIAGTEADVASKNQMRSTIKEVFPVREAWTLVRPALDEAKLQRLDTLPAAEMRPEFRTGMEGLAKMLATKLQPLQINGTTINGTVYTGLISRYVDAINAGAVPELVSAWQGVAQAECQRALAAALQLLGSGFKEDPNMEEGQLYDMYKAALAAALTAFRETALGDSALVGEYEAKLRAEAQGRYEAAKQQLAVTGERLAVQLLEEASRELTGLMGKPGVTLDQVESTLRKLLSNYERQVPSGPYKYKKASEFMMNTCIIGIKQHVAGIIAAKEAAEKRLVVLDGQLSQARQQAGQVGSLQQQLSAAREEVTAKLADAARLEGELAAKSRALLAAEAKSAEGGTALTAAAGREQRLAARVAELEATQGQAAEVRKQVDALQKQLANGASQYQQLQQQEAAAQQEVVRLQGEAAGARQHAAGLQQQLQQLQGLQGQLGALQSQVAERDAALAAKEAELAQYRVGGQRVEGERDAERELATKNMQRLNEVEANLLKERTAHDATRQQLKAATAQLAQLRANAGFSSPDTAGAAAAAAAGSGAGGGGRAAASARGKRGAGAMEPGADLPAAGDDQVTPAAAGGRSTKKQRVQSTGGAADAEMQDSPASPFQGVPAVGGAMAVPVDKDINPSAMTINELKAWVTDSRLEDEEFLNMVSVKGTKKKDWVAYVEKKLAAV